MPDWNHIAQITSHRPWPLPQRRWVMTMSWVNLLAAHWPIAPEAIEDRIPHGLSLDTWEGQAWITVVPFEMDNTLPRGLTWWPRPMRFAELNVRTYVTANGHKPGVWFFNLEAASRLAVWGARKFFYLPYFNADMSVEVKGEQIGYQSLRTHRRAPPARFIAEYGPTGPPQVASEGSFEQWIMERYCLYAEGKSTIYRCDVHHPPWPLRPATAEITENTLFEALGLELPAQPETLHYARSIDVLGWGLKAL